MFVITPTSGPIEPGEQIDLPQRAHPHFHDRGRMVRIELQERERHADMVVQVPLVLEHRTFLLQDAGEHLLGRGLAVRAGDAHDGNRELPAVQVRHLLERGERIFHRQDIRQPAETGEPCLQALSARPAPPRRLFSSPREQRSWPSKRSPLIATNSSPSRMVRESMDTPLISIPRHFLPGSPSTGFFQIRS